MMGAIVALLAACAAAEPSRGLLVPVDGSPLDAQFVAADDAWHWTFQSGSVRRELPAASVVRWGRPAEPARGPVAVLADGGLLSGEVLRIDSGQVVLESDSLTSGGSSGAIHVPLERLAGLILARPGDRAGQDRLADEILAATGSTDRLILANGDRLDGVVTDVDARQVQWETAGQPASLPRERVIAVAFNPALRAKADGSGLRAWVGLSDGTRLLVDRLLLDGSTLRVTPAGAGDAAPWSTESRTCVFLQPVGGRAAYLSDRPADGFRHVPFLDLAWPYRDDRNVLGGRLRAGGQLYLKGIGVHSAARLTYMLGESYTRFEAAAALDDAAGRGGVRYHVLVDGQRRYTSEPVRGGDSPLPVRVDVTDAKRLDLVVDFGERADQLDYADWLDARLIRPEKPPEKAEPKEAEPQKPEPQKAEPQKAEPRP